MGDYDGDGHEISYTRDGLGYCSKCDDWHDLEDLFGAPETDWDGVRFPGPKAGAAAGSLMPSPYVLESAPR